MHFSLPVKYPKYTVWLAGYLKYNRFTNVYSTRKSSCVDVRRAPALSPDWGGEVPHPVQTRGVPIESLPGGYPHPVLTGGTPMFPDGGT